MSDGLDVASWPSPEYPVSVQVILSILINVVNLSLAVGLSEGYKISWWLKALKGARLTELQFDLEVQKSLSAFKSSSRSWDRFAVAAAAALAVSVADGPLIQRASTSGLKTIPTGNASVEVSVSSDPLPGDFSAFINHGTILLQPIFTQVSKAYSAKDDITLQYSGCNDKSACFVTIPGPGFDIHCDETSVPYDLTEYGADVTTFSVHFHWDDSMNIWSYGSVNYTVTYKPQSSCVGSLTRRQCHMQLATVAYPVTLANGSAKLHTWQPSTNETLHLANLTDVDLVGTASNMLGGIAFVLKSIYESSLAGSMQKPGPPGNSLPSRRDDADGDTLTYWVNNTGLAAANYLHSGRDTYERCNMTFGDPTDDIYNTARELMFRSAIANAASNTSSNATPSQLLPATSEETVTAYQSHYEYLGAVIVITVFQVGLILFLLSGWWHLGRDVSLNPFEIGKALGAATLGSMGSNNTIDGIIQAAGSRTLRYGEMEEDARGGVEAKSSSSPMLLDEYQSPVDDEAGVHGNGTSGALRRLRLGDVEVVRDVQPGVVYY